MEIIEPTDFQRKQLYLGLESKSCFRPSHLLLLAEEDNNPSFQRGRMLTLSVTEVGSASLAVPLFLLVSTLSSGQEQGPDR